MKNKLTDNLSAYEIFLMEASGENTHEPSKINVELIVPKKYGNVYSAMHIPKEMGASELLKIIDANELTEFNTHSTHVKDNGQYRNSGELEDKTVYGVHTKNPDNTVNLIMNYKHNNSN